MLHVQYMHNIYRHTIHLYMYMHVYTNIIIIQVVFILEVVE